MPRYLRSKPASTDHRRLPAPLTGGIAAVTHRLPAPGCGGVRRRGPEALPAREFTGRLPSPVQWIVLFFEFFPMFITVVITIAAIGLYIANRRHPFDAVEEETRRRRDRERRERARRQPPEKGGGRRPSMSS